MEFVTGIITHTAVRTPVVHRNRCQIVEHLTQVNADVVLNDGIVFDGRRICGRRMYNRNGTELQKTTQIGSWNVRLWCWCCRRGKWVIFSESHQLKTGMNVQSKFRLDAGTHFGHHQLIQYACDFRNEILWTTKLDGATIHQTEMEIHGRVKEILKKVEISIICVESDWLWILPEFVRSHSMCSVRTHCANKWETEPRDANRWMTTTSVRRWSVSIGSNIR